MTATKNESIIALFVSKISNQYDRRVYIEQTIDPLLCNRAWLQLKTHNATYSLPTLLTVITWVTTKKHHFGINNVFQCLIATNKKESYLMFIYTTLTESEGTVGFLDSTCGETMSNTIKYFSKNATTYNEVLRVQ